MPTCDDLAQRLQSETPALRRFVSRLTGHHDAEDVVQDTLQKAWKHRASYRPGDFGAWLRTIAFRVFLDLRKRNARNPTSLGDADTELCDARAGSFEDKQELERLLLQLTAMEQNILLAFHRRGDSLLEIAQGLSMPLGTIKSHLHRARRKLADARLRFDQEDKI